MQPHLPQLADEENEHEPEECGCSSRAHQNDYLNVWPSFIPCEDKELHEIEKTNKKKTRSLGAFHELINYYIDRDVSRIALKATQRRTCKKSTLSIGVW